MRVCMTQICATRITTCSDVGTDYDYCVDQSVSPGVNVCEEKIDSWEISRQRACLEVGSMFHHSSGSIEYVLVDRSDKGIRNSLKRRSEKGGGGYDQWMSCFNLTFGSFETIDCI